MNNFELIPLEKCVKRVKVGYVGPIDQYYCDKSTGVKIIRPSEITSRGIDENSLKYVTCEFHEKNKKSQLHKGDIVISRCGKDGIPNIYEGNEAAQVLNAVIIEPDEEKLSSYVIKLFLEIPSIQKQITNTTGGSVQGVINTKSIADLKIPYSDSMDYAKIALLINLLEKKIALNAKLIEELESLAKTIYDYWFVQFEFPNEDGKSYKYSGGKMTWNEELKREIPDGWKVKEVGKVLITVLGGTPSTNVNEYWENGNINWLSSGELGEFPIVKANAKITEAAVENSATQIMPIGSVAISITRYIRPTILGIDSCANQSVVGILESETFLNSYLYPYFKNQVAGYLLLRTGAMQPHINKETINKSLIIEPPFEILKEYYIRVNCIYNKILNNAFENQELLSLRDFLLPLLMNGQVTFKDAN